MAWFWTLLALVNYSLVGFTLFTILRRRREPGVTLAWTLAVVFIPFIGVFLYWLVVSNRIGRRAHRRRKRVANLLLEFRKWTESRGLSAAEVDLAPELSSFERIGRKLTGLPATGGNDVTIYDNANETYAAIGRAIYEARDHVHLEYYIFNADATGRHFRELLIEKARSGVECRLLLDSGGCFGLPNGFVRPMLEAGVQVSFFLPLWAPRRRFSIHLRNHRKIAVVDGRMAFTGSQNIGDEYRGRQKRLSPWYDTHLGIRGPAALALQQVFAEDWLFATGQRLVLERYFPPPQVCGNCIVQVMPTGPDQSFSALETMLFAAVSSARRVLRIETPYFAPDAATRAALTYACHRGVQVVLILPTLTDSRLALYAARSFYAELMECGARVFEYDGGVLHSKIIAVDDTWAIVGSANMDVRSFRLNFEITALLYDSGLTQKLCASIDKHCEQARRVEPREVWNKPLRDELLEGAARLFTPLL